jgi:AraC-like DNA-binding protein
MRAPADISDPVHVVYETRRLMLAEFHCEPWDRRWSEPNCADEGHHVVFPGTPVRIEQEGHDPVVATPAQVMFYNRFQAYRRADVAGRGDHCSFVLVSPEVLEDVACSAVPGLADPLARPFPASHATTGAGTYLAQRALLRHVRTSSPPDDVFVQERLYELIARTVAVLYEGPRTGATTPRRAATRALHAEVVESAKALMSTRLGERLTLEGIAAMLFVSPFELTRMFRRRTGTSVHSFLVQLRLRAGLERVLDSRDRLTDIACDLGFSSPSHFSDSFRRVFGLAPSAARALAGSRSGTRTFLEVASRAAS